MRHEIIPAPEAQQAFRDLPARVRSQVRDALEVHLRLEPTKVRRSRIKRLRGISRPQVLNEFKTVKIIRMWTHCE
jgi:hypothetical protein